MSQTDNTHLFLWLAPSEAPTGVTTSKIFSKYSVHERYFFAERIFLFVWYAFVCQSYKISGRCIAVIDILDHQLSAFIFGCLIFIAAAESSKLDTGSAGTSEYFSQNLHLFVNFIKSLCPLYSRFRYFFTISILFYVGRLIFIETVEFSKFRYWLVVQSTTTSLNLDSP